MKATLSKVLEMSNSRPNLILLRGLPGVGKSYLAQMLVGSATYEKEWAWLESDMYMVDEYGQYRFDRSRLTTVHSMCRGDTLNLLRRGYKNVVVANTFTQIWEIEAYDDIAYICNAGLIVCTVLSHRWTNVHGVPESKIMAMRDRWEDWPGEKFFENNSESY